MAPMFRRLLLTFLAGATVALAAPPVGLAGALERLRDQKSYSWEVINADPGPVSQQVETRRGAVTMVQQNTSPHIKGCIDRNGDLSIEREWIDGLRLQTIITREGTMVTNTPEGWMTEREVLGALADERVKGGMSQRHLWLRRADRPEIRRPDEELVPLLKSAMPFEASGDAYTVRGRIRSDGSVIAETDDDANASAVVMVTMNVSGGVVRDYEVKVDTTRRIARSRSQLAVSDQRIVIITYLPTPRLDIPTEAREKLTEAKTSSARPRATN